jgi:putative flippase GtrA
MRKSTVRHGLSMIIAGIAAVTLAAFFPAQVADFLKLSSAGEARFIFFGFFWGGLFAGFGMLVAIAGLLRSGAGGMPVRLLPVLLIMVAMIIIFCVMLFFAVRAPEQPRLRPGETITI